MNISGSVCLRHSDASLIRFHWPLLKNPGVIDIGFRDPHDVSPTFHDLLPLSKLMQLRSTHIEGLPTQIGLFSMLTSKSIDNPAKIFFPAEQSQLGVSHMINPHDICPRPMTPWSLECSLDV